MRGNWNVKFCNNINPVFICLVAAAIWHCHKELKGVEQVGETINFMYETAASKCWILCEISSNWGKADSFHRLRNTWSLYNIRVRNVILANIKADLCTLIGGFDKEAEVELSDPCAVVEDDSYVYELQQDWRGLSQVKIWQNQTHHMRTRPWRKLVTLNSWWPR